MQPSTPILVARDGRLAWQFDDGTIVRYVGGGADDGDEKKFTQAEVDKLIQDRVARVKAEPPADYAQLKSDATELATLKATAAADAAAKLTEAEATAARIAALEANVTKSNEAMEAAQAAALVEKKRSAFISTAVPAKIVNPAQAWSLLSQAQKDAVTIGDDGQVTGAAEVAAKFAEDNPHFVGTDGAAGRQTPPASRHQGKEGDATPSVASGREMFDAQRAPKRPASTTTNT